MDERLWTAPKYGYKNGDRPSIIGSFVYICSLIDFEQLNDIKTRRFHAIFVPVIIEFSRCIGTYSSAKFEYIKNLYTRLHSYAATVHLSSQTARNRRSAYAKIFAVIASSFVLLLGIHAIPTLFSHDFLNPGTNSDLSSNDLTGQETDSDLATAN